ncbi:hypothetical protein, partial [Enterobacter hormaechei]|uniref:hypothetical protein n=1 Tax=Enterobacter hormaechei TaxID=158836 RepID=UPI0013D8970F
GWDLWSGSWAQFVKNPDNLGQGEQHNEKGADAVLSFRTPATSKLKLERSFPRSELGFVQATTKTPAKITLMGPDRV